MLRSGSKLIICAPLLLAACATSLPPGITDSNAGFATVEARTRTATGQQATLTQTRAQAAAVNRRVHGLVHQKTISADTAVQVALLNNKGLQASYASIGLSSAEVWQEATPENPIVSIGVLGIGAPELGLYRSLEALIGFNLASARTRKQRVAVASADFQEAQLEAVVDTLALANRTRQAWIEAVGAFETVTYLKRASVAADASSELAARLGETGSLNKAGQAREQAFTAELAGQLARARLNAALAKEDLTRLMGLWGTEVDYYVPDALPSLPGRLSVPQSVERAALSNRVDLEVAQLGLAATARAFRLTDATRTLTDLELVAGVETEREAEDGDTDTVTTPQVELAFAIPIYDSGQARLRRAELTYLQAANVLAERAVNVRSEARAAETDYRSSHRIARHYRDVVVPLRETIEEEALLSYSGMITNTFELLIDTREKLASELEAAEAKKDFWLASANLTAAIYGGGADADGEGVDIELAGGGEAEE